MKRIRTAMTVFVVALATSATTPERSNARVREDCRTRGSTIAANATTRLFSTFNRLTRSRKYYACWVPRRRTRYIGRRDGDDGVQATIALSGRHLAYEDVNCDRDTGWCNGSVWLYDVRSGRESVVVQPLEEPASPATDLSLSPDLAVAWIRPAPEGYRVVRARVGELAIVDAGSAIEPGSLVTDGRRFYWTDAGAPQSVPAR